MIARKHTSLVRVVPIELTMFIFLFPFEPILLIRGVLLFAIPVRKGFCRSHGVRMSFDAVRDVEEGLEPCQ